MFSVIIVIIIHSDCGGRDKCVAIRNPPKPALLVPTVVSPSHSFPLSALHIVITL